MQYKIPVQIENEDPIILGLSLRQLTIIMIGGGIAYSVFKSMEQNFGGETAAFPAGFILLVAVVVAIFKNSEMTFLPFVLNLIRLSINSKQRIWAKGVDSFSKIEIGFISPYE
ncbi:PrgI family protein, partial [Candidatus Gracilibacteria bacterium]|nr:PrgI family protein [Candidatus Gracilibacteria bacterium]